MPLGKRRMFSVPPSDLRATVTALSIFAFIRFQTTTITRRRCYIFAADLVLERYLQLWKHKEGGDAIHLA